MFVTPQILICTGVMIGELQSTQLVDLRERLLDREELFQDRRPA